MYLPEASSDRFRPARAEIHAHTVYFHGGHDDRVWGTRTHDLRAGLVGRVHRHPIREFQCLRSADPQLTLLSPCGFIATNYIVLPRLATHISSEDCLFLPPRRIVRIFVWSDVITFLLQGGGSGVTAMNNGTVANIGKYVGVACID